MKNPMMATAFLTLLGTLPAKAEYYTCYSGSAVRIETEISTYDLNLLFNLADVRPNAAALMLIVNPNAKTETANTGQWLRGVDQANEICREHEKTHPSGHCETLDLTAQRPGPVACKEVNTPYFFCGDSGITTGETGQSMDYVQRSHGLAAPEGAETALYFNYVGEPRWMEDDLTAAMQHCALEQAEVPEISTASVTSGSSGNWSIALKDTRATGCPAVATPQAGAFSNRYLSSGLRQIQAPFTPGQLISDSGFHSGWRSSGTNSWQAVGADLDEGGIATRTTFSISLISETQANISALMIFNVAPELAAMSPLSESCRFELDAVATRQN
ncbi:hypothetical protein [Halocynthiibacter styelae]|uniref:Uncharacterized protein n=1 Tax=Halocynthiibacter styelae TaxID=2761955 RepID=A0A8J7IHE4_9RHOB|nr:hypothetical protein [Paenihalocynthiibacter styelae]MBI1492023.1 hypothetical protein [Paenihalocynthiibacter styelae]